MFRAFLDPHVAQGHHDVIQNIGNPGVCKLELLDVMLYGVDERGVTVATFQRIEPPFYVIDQYAQSFIDVYCTLVEVIELAAQAFQGMFKLLAAHVRFFRCGLAIIIK